MKKYTGFIGIAALLCSFLLGGCGNTDSGTSEKEQVTIGVGYQTVTAQTWEPLIMKNKGFLEEELQKVEPNKKITIDWQNAQSGPPLTNNMIAGKLQFADMGDMPILINGEKGETMSNYDAVFLGFDGKGCGGKNQAILVPSQSPIQSVQDLAGKTVATPIGSSAHRMLLAELDSHYITDQVTIVGQDATVGLSNISQGKIDAYAIWEPFPTLAVQKGAGRILIGGEDTGIDYLDGIVADRKWVKEHEAYTVAFLKALIRAHDFIKGHPNEAAKIFAQESGYSEDVARKMAESIRFDSVIYQKDRQTLEGSKQFLQKTNTLKNLNIDQFIDDSYLRKAFQELGKSYPDDSQLQKDWLTQP